MTINDNNSDLIEIAKACGAISDGHQYSVRIDAEQLQATIDAVNAQTNNEPVGYFYSGRRKQPNVRLEEWLSISENDHWPVDQWDEITVSKVYLSPPNATIPSQSNEAVNDAVNANSEPVGDKFICEAYWENEETKDTLVFDLITPERIVICFDYNKDTLHVMRTNDDKTINSKVYETATPPSQSVNDALEKAARLLIKQ